MQMAFVTTSVTIALGSSTGISSDRSPVFLRTHHFAGARSAPSMLFSLDLLRVQVPAH